MIRDKHSGHRMSGWEGDKERKLGVRGSWGQSLFHPEMWRHFDGKFFHWGEI